MDDTRLLETVCWAMSQRSLTPGAKCGHGTITREDVWAALGACRLTSNGRTDWQDAGPDLIYLEAHRLAQSDAAHRRSPVAEAERRFTAELDAAVQAKRRPDELDLMRRRQQLELDAIRKALTSSAGVVVWNVDLRTVRDQIAVAANRRLLHGRIELAQEAAEYALAHWREGRLAGERWTAEYCAKRVRWTTTDGLPATGVRLAVFVEYTKAARDVLHTMRDEAMSRFRRQLMDARREAA